LWARNFLHCRISFRAKLFFWSREQGSAEVDYLISHQGKIYPVEVKAGTTGKLKSLQLFIQEKKAPFGIKISSDALGFDKGISLFHSI